MINFIMAHLGWIGWGVSEIIALIPGIKSNSIVQLVVSVLKSIVDAMSADKPSK